MWITLFSLALGAAVCFGVAAVILAHSKSMAAQLSGITRSANPTASERALH
jgi:hypothetical protein